jgi:acyl carrier protein
MTIQKPLIRSAVTALLKQPVQDDQPLVSSGLVDSLRVLTLITALEEKLGVRIPTDRLQPEDFDSVDCIVETLARLGIK